MAILHSGPNGGFSGKAGSIVGVIRLGTAIIRGMPKKSKKNKKGTTAQNESRSKFSQIQLLLKPLIPFIRVGFNMEARSRNMTAHNAAKSYNMLNAFNAVGELDYAKVLTSFGKLPGAVSPTVTRDAVGIHFTWENNSEDKWADTDDQVMLLAYDPANNLAYGITSGARRQAKMETLELHPLVGAQELHTWIAFISDDRERVSISSYLGIV